MRKRILSALALAGALLFLAAGTARAQAQTNVTATITDPLGIPYSNGTYSIQLIPTGNNPTVNGQAIGGAFNGSTDANGKINVALWPNASISPGGTTWQFTICTNSGGIAPPLGTGNQCTPPTAVTISGTSQSLSATLSAVAPKLTTITIGGITSVVGSAPIVATTLAGVVTVSCPTCGTGTIAGAITATHLTFASAANTAGDVLGSAVTAGTGAISLTATGIAVTPLSIQGTSALQQNFLLNVGTFGNASQECTVCGELAVFHGKGLFSNVPLVVIEGVDDTVNLLQFRNQLSEAGGGFARIRFFNTLGLQIDSIAASGNAAGSLLLSDSAQTNYLTVTSGGTVGSTFKLSNAGAASLTNAAATGSASFSVGTDNSVPGTFLASNSAANAHTTWGSQATTSNEVDGPATVAVTGDLVSWTTSGVIGKLTDSGVPAAHIPIGNLGSAGLSGTSPIVVAATGAISCPTCSTATAAKGIVTATYTNATTGQTAITGLSIALAANTNYAIHCALIWQQSALGSLIVSSTGPAAPTKVTAESNGAANPGAGAGFFQAADGATFGFSLTAGIAGTTNADLYATVEVGVLNGANAGTFQLTAASTAAATLTIQPGSFCMSE